jgi:hypothetical protein
MPANPQSSSVKPPKTVMESFFTFYLFCVFLILVLLGLSYWRRKEWLTPYTLQAYANSVIHLTTLDESTKAHFASLDKSKAEELEKEEWVKVETEKAKAREAFTSLLQAYTEGKIHQGHLKHFYSKALSLSPTPENPLTLSELLELTSYIETLKTLDLPQEIPSSPETSSSLTTPEDPAQKELLKETPSDPSESTSPQDSTPEEKKKDLLEPPPKEDPQDENTETPSEEESLKEKSSKEENPKEEEKDTFDFEEEPVKEGGEGEER